MSFAFKCETSDPNSESLDFKLETSDTKLESLVSKFDISASILEFFIFKFEISDSKLLIFSLNDSKSKVRAVVGTKVGAVFEQWIFSYLITIGVILSMK